MPTNTYVALATQTLGSATASVTFSSIPQGYTDLVLIITGTVSSEGAVRFQCNGDTATNYSTTLLYGNGSSALSGRAANQNFGAVGRIGTVVSNSIIHFMNYSNTTTNKTVISRGNTSNLFVTAQATLWRATPAAITSIVLTPENAANWDSGSTFSLYGIAASSVGAKATGGIISSDANYYYHTFLASGTFTPTQSLTCEVLAVGGGGGSASAWNNTFAGGGNSGTVTYNSSVSTTATNYAISVGGGGTGGADSNGNTGGTGTSSTFNTTTVVAAGGTGGAHNNSVLPNGGSGAGVAATNSNGANGTLTYSSWGLTTGTGQNVSSTYYYAGGGGSGLSSSQSGTAGTGGYGGGAAGVKGSPFTANAGTANTGGGAGGAGGGGALGATGGSGIVIVRYAK